MTDSDTLTSPIISLDEVIGEEAACETTQEPDCGRRVEWLAVNHCCGHQMLLCTYHKERGQAEIEKQRRIYKRLSCLYCGKSPANRQYIPV